MILFALLACGGAPAPDAHDHAEGAAHDHAEDAHDHGDDAHDHGEGHHEGAHDQGGETKVPVDAAKIEVAMGAHTARLVPGGGQVELQVLGKDGAPIAAEGEARMVLTGTGEAEQKVVLKADGASWKGEAKVGGAPGYLAVVSVPVSGTTQSARFVWGEVQEAAPAPKPHDHGDGAHEDHGDHGHAH